MGPDPRPRADLGGAPFRLTGDRVFALYAAGYATGSFAVQSLRIDFAHHLFGLRMDQWAMIAIWITGVSYLIMTAGKQGPDTITPAVPQSSRRAAGVCRSRGPGTSRGQSSRSGCSQRVRCFANRTKRG